MTVILCEVLLFPKDSIKLPPTVRNTTNTPLSLTNPSPMQPKMACKGTPKETITSDNTSLVEGQDLGEARRLWRDCASSESRLSMMTKLISLKVGFNDVEIFSLGLIYNSKTIENEDALVRKDEKVVRAAMEFKRADEIRNRRKLMLMKKQWRERE